MVILEVSTNPREAYQSSCCIEDQIMIERVKNEKIQKGKEQNVRRLLT